MGGMSGVCLVGSRSGVCYWEVCQGCDSGRYVRSVLVGGMSGMC